MPRAPISWVLDSSILVSYLRYGRYRPFLLAGLRRKAIFIPAVVLCELYAGAISRGDRADLEMLRRALGPQLLTIETEDWILAGRCLATYAARWGRLRPRDHVVDVVVAASAARRRAVLVSEDVRQMKRWSLVLGRAGKTLRVAALPK